MITDIALGLAAAVIVYLAIYYFIRRRHLARLQQAYLTGAQDGLSAVQDHVRQVKRG